MGHSQKCFAFHARDRRFVETPPTQRQSSSLQASLYDEHLSLSGIPISTMVKFTKGAGRMPWHQEPKKDVISCEKLRGGANIH